MNVKGDLIQETHVPDTCENLDTYRGRKPYNGTYTTTKFIYLIQVIKHFDDKREKNLRLSFSRTSYIGLHSQVLYSFVSYKTIGTRHKT